MVMELLYCIVHGAMSRITISIKVAKLWLPTVQTLTHV